MNKFHTHIILVSGQAAPNLLPTLDAGLKPQHVILLVTKVMQAQANYLVAVFKQSEISCEQIAIDDEHDFAAMSEELLRIAAKTNSSSIALNVTGGTKLMALAAHSVAQAADWPTFYVDVDTDEVVWLPRASVETPARKKISEQLRLRIQVMT